MRSIPDLLAPYPLISCHFLGVCKKEPFDFVPVRCWLVCTLDASAAGVSSDGLTVLASLRV